MFQEIGSLARAGVVALAFFGTAVLAVSTGVFADSDDNRRGATGVTGPSQTPGASAALATATPQSTLVPGFLTPADPTPLPAATQTRGRSSDDGSLHDLNDDRGGDRSRSDDNGTRGRGGDDDDDYRDDYSGRQSGDDDDDDRDDDRRGSNRGSSDDDDDDDRDGDEDDDRDDDDDDDRDDDDDDDNDD